MTLDPKKVVGRSGVVDFGRRVKIKRRFLTDLDRISANRESCISDDVIFVVMASNLLVHHFLKLKKTGQDEPNLILNFYLVDTGQVQSIFD